MCPSNECLIRITTLMIIYLLNDCTPTQPYEKEDLVIGFLAGYGYSKVALGALPFAIAIVNNDSELLPNHTLRFIAADIGSSLSVSPLPIKEMSRMRDENVAAFIGPDEVCTTEALVASAWNLPMISYKCADTAVSNKTIYEMFARTLAPASKVSKSVIALLKAFNWSKFVIITAARPAWGSQITQAIKTLAESRSLIVTDVREILDYIPTQISKMQQIVDETYKTTRIYVFVGEHIAMVDFVRCLQNRKLLETGNYMVISVDDEIYDPKRRSNIMEREYLDPYLNRFRSRALDLQSFRSVLKLTPSHPSNPKITEISASIKQYSKEKPFNVPYHTKISKTISVPIYGAHLYDAVLIYARAANEVLISGGDIKDGQKIMQRILKRSYRSILGFDVFIDSNGDAEGNYTVIALQNDTSIQSNSSVRMSMQPVGYFVYNNSPGDIPEFRYLNKKRTIHWIKGMIPRAEPICGFMGELCRPKKKDWRFVISGVFVALFIAVAGAFLIKHYRYEQTLACLLWKVDMKEVTLITTDNLDSSTRTRSLFQTCRHSLITGGDTSKRAFTSIGLYRGNIVAVKRIYKKSVDLTRNIRKELKQMREVHHENIATFIGCSVDHGSVAILTSYCARGSLEDVLANDDLFLDHMFISSLVSDILKGIIYLHDSDIVSHGNLKSSNCLVDSRWVCQITDFGLHEFKMGQDKPKKDESDLRNELWCAPELLRHPYPPTRGTQKGDVYSFGVLLYEIIGRNGPFGESNLTNREIVNKVKNPTTANSFFRPSVRHLNVPEYIISCLKSCWDEDPEIRPDIRLVRIKLKEMQAGLKPNIFDNMLAIMEKYAYNLEGLVQERTNQLYEEKKKTEALLHRMLPKTVAESLKRGEPVEAEGFDCVTIFFSDLVGFTELCAKSTPLEIIEMLSDLYTCCDSIISNYDVYKVETIGDAYMVVSGLPLRNGDRHVGEIASLALHLLDRISKIEIKHRPGELLQIRAGIHSGQCVAGVVGLKMPRYCLFGDTVNTASRMESTGEPMRIHISSTTYNLLKKIGGYKCEDRGLTYIKGKGDLRTYWLKGEDLNKKIERLAFYADRHNVAPDLICNKTPPPPQTSPASQYNVSNYSLNIHRRAKNSYTNVISSSDQQISLLNQKNSLNRGELFADCCYFCQKRNAMRYSELNNSQNKSLYECDVIYNITDTQSNSYTCDCKPSIQLFRNHIDGNKLSCNTNYNRAPRSAPHISFMQ